MQTWALPCSKAPSTSGPDVSIGNRWDVGVFTIGADWLGVYVPLTQTSAQKDIVRDLTGEVVQTIEVPTGSFRSPLEIRLMYIQVGLSF